MVFMDDKGVIVVGVERDDPSGGGVDGNSIGPIGGIKPLETHVSDNRTGVSISDSVTGKRKAGRPKGTKRRTLVKASDPEPLREGATGIPNDADEASEFEALSAEEQEFVQRVTQKEPASVVMRELYERRGERPTLEAVEKTAQRWKKRLRAYIVMNAPSELDTDEAFDLWYDRNLRALLTKPEGQVAGRLNVLREMGRLRKERRGGDIRSQLAQLTELGKRMVELQGLGRVQGGRPSGTPVGDGGVPGASALDPVPGGG